MLPEPLPTIALHLLPTVPIPCPLRLPWNGILKWNLVWDWILMIFFQFQEWSLFQVRTAVCYSKTAIIDSNEICVPLIKLKFHESL